MPGSWQKMCQRAVEPGPHIRFSFLAHFRAVVLGSPWDKRGEIGGKVAVGWRVQILSAARICHGRRKRRSATPNGRTVAPPDTRQGRERADSPPSRTIEGESFGVRSGCRAACLIAISPCLRKPYRVGMGETELHDGRGGAKARKGTRRRKGAKGYRRANFCRGSG